MTPPDQPATVHGGTAADWYHAYLSIRQSWQVLKGCGPAINIHWPADRLPITRPIEETP